jgi:amino acid transporter
MRASATVPNFGDCDLHSDPLVEGVDMAIDDPTRPTASAEDGAPATHQRLKAGSIGLIAVLFMAVANAAPITAMTGNVPIAIGYGNGSYTPAGFLVATIVLTLFTVGFVAMARHITTAGAFYGFISHGLGQVLGMASGALATMAYVVFEGSLVGIFSWFADDAFNEWFGWHINWLIYAAVCIAVVAILGYYDISIAAVVLGVFLVCEIILLSALSISVLVKGGGPTGLHAGSINPIKAFSSLPEGGGFGGKDIAAGSAAIGLFFAFWSWVGFETTAVYGEESRNPKRIVPRATLIAVVGLGLFYTFVSWMVIAGAGPETAIKDSAAGDGIGLFTDLAAKNLGGHWVVNVYLFLIVSGSFACAMAFHNAASRYLYAIGREVPSWRRTIGAAHHKHGSPHIASGVQTVVTVLLTLGFYFFTRNGSDVTQGAYIYEYGLLAILGTMAILIVQSICSLAVIWYFHVKKVHPGNIITTGIIPALGGLGMIYVVYLLFSNLSFAGGAGAKSPFFHAIPWIVLVTFLAGLGWALTLRSRQPEVFNSIGRTVLDEARERV